MRAALLATSLAALGCTNAKAPVGSEASAWSLVWSDEFDGAEQAPIDDDSWQHDIGGDGWGNDQLEYNTDSTDNVRTDGRGVLEIVAREQSYEGNDYTSGRIKTQDRFEFGYGRVEANIKVPKGSGIWPAFWLLGADFEEVGWPSCGEIDILELQGENPATSLGTVHGPDYSGAAGVGATYTLDEGDFSDDYHLFAVDIDPGHIAWSIDGEVFHTLTQADLPAGSTWVFDGEWFIILNVAVGGHFVGEVDEDALPAYMQVDYVRVYERAE